MLTPENFQVATQWSGILTLAFAALAGLGFLLQWGIRFRLVGTTGFMVVLTVGLFSLSFVPLARTEIPGAVRYALVYDNGGTHVVITVPPTIQRPELEATLQQAASNLFSLGRLAQDSPELTIRARTILHPTPDLSQPLYLGQIRRSLLVRNDDHMEIEISSQNLAQLPPAPPSSS